MRIIAILLSVFLLTGCYKEYPVYISPIDQDEVVYVVDPGYGADCEDDSEIIQEALNEHGVVKLPAGIYYIDTTIIFSHNMKLIGEGIPGRYPDTAAFGTAINIGENVDKIFSISDDNFGIYSEPSNKEYRNKYPADEIMNFFQDYQLLPY